MENKEIWKNVIGYEGIYQVSNYQNALKQITNPQLSLF